MHSSRDKACSTTDVTPATTERQLGSPVCILFFVGGGVNGGRPLGRSEDDEEARRRAGFRLLPLSTTSRFPCIFRTPSYLDNYSYVIFLQNYSYVVFSKRTRFGLSLGRVGWERVYLLSIGR